KTAFAMRSKEDSRELAMGVLVRDHIRSDKLGAVCERMRYGTRKEYATFLHEVMKESPHHEVRGLACLSLAQFLYSHSVKLDLLTERPELARRYEELLGKEYFDEMRRKGHDGLTREVESLLQEACSK